MKAIFFLRKSVMVCPTPFAQAQTAPAQPTRRKPTPTALSPRRRVSAHTTPSSLPLALPASRGLPPPPRRHTGPTMAAPARARFVHNRRRGRAAEESSDEEGHQQQDASSSSSDDDGGEEEEEEEAEFEGSDEEGDAEEEEEAVADQPAARESPAAAGRGGRKGPITISLKKVCKVVPARRRRGFPYFL